VLWLDSVLVGEQAAYDIDVAPPLYSGAPSWSFEEVEIGPSAKGEVDLGTRRLPEASYARATVLDAGGEPVPNAEVHVYQLPPVDYCTQQVPTALAECQPAARLRGVWLSDADGVVRVVLPDP
jgi:protocatechuate 3,4-dioxygenase beta subunit